MNFAVLSGADITYTAGNYLELLSWMPHAPEEDLTVCITYK